jgi:hypothetical protein
MTHLFINFTPKSPVIQYGNAICNMYLGIFPYNKRSEPKMKPNYTKIKPPPNKTSPDVKPITIRPLTSNAGTNAAPAFAVGLMLVEVDEVGVVLAPLFVPVNPAPVLVAVLEVPVLFPIGRTPVAVSTNELVWLAIPLTLGIAVASALISIMLLVVELKFVWAIATTLFLRS